MNGDGNGNMPFAVIAVTLLMMSVVCAAVVGGYDRASDSSDDLADETEAVEEAVRGMTAHVNRGLGDIIRSVSVDPSLGGMDGRVAEFGERAGSWLEWQFPLEDRGAVAKLVSHNVDLVAESLSVPDDRNAAGGYVPAYLRGVGTVEVEVRSAHGVSSRTLEISTDGSYALPLSMEQGSLFENMAGDGSASLSQMVSYQLTCLAQSRVLNGYGAIAEHGGRGTMSIITSEDVDRAYRNAVDAIGLICFRSGPEGLAEAGRADLADILASDGGTVSVDLGAVYSQSLVGAIDDIVLRWFDYFCGDEVLDIWGDRHETARLLSDMIVSFIKGESVVGAESYIREVMDRNGVPESVYRHPGSGTTSGTVCGVRVSVANPVSDLFEQRWVKSFKFGYYHDGNYIVDLMRSVLNGAAVRIGESMEDRTLTFEVDPYDDVPFTRALEESMDSALSEMEDIVWSQISWSLESGGFVDPFCAAIASSAREKRQSMILEDEFRSALRAAVAEAAGDDADINAMMASEDAERMVMDYRRAVVRDISSLDLMETVSGGGPGVVEDLLSGFTAYGLGAMSVLVPAERYARNMVRGMVESCGINPHGGVTELPGSDCFVLFDGDGNSTRERLKATIDVEPVVTSISVDEGLCVHMTGDGGYPRYTTVFSIRLLDDPTYGVEGSGTLSDAFGTLSSSVSGGFAVDMNLDIPVTSAWALKGVQYEASWTVFDDLSEAAIEVLGPILEPLREVMTVVREVLSAVGESLLEIGRHVVEVLEDVYTRIMEPLEAIGSWISGNIDRIVSDAALRFFFEIGLDEQNIAFEYLGYRLEVSTSAVSWGANTKTLFDATLSGPLAGLMVSAGITAKLKGDPDRENLVLTGHGGIEGDDWSLKMKLDPLMKAGSRLITADGEYKDVDISLTAPELANYREMGLSLRDFDGPADILDNIPLPIPGLKASVDAGFNLKYSTPVKKELVVNEFESNPPGEDGGNEWVELLNNSGMSVDLDGYTLIASSDRRNKVMELSGTLMPGERLVVEPDFTLVNSSGKYTKNGEALTIKDPDGNVVDKTPTLRDTSNDGNSWQRRFDASTEWEFRQSTRDAPNSGSSLEMVFPPADLKDITADSIESAFGDVGTITDLESMEAFLESLVRHTLDNMIKHATAQIVEASVYVSVEVKDVTGSASSGIRVALTADSQLAGDVLRYIAGQLQTLLLNVDNPYRIDPLEMFTENIDLDVMLTTGVGIPEILSKGADLPEADLGVSFRTNLASITRVLGEDTGRPEVNCGIGILDCPEAAIPGSMRPKADMEHDLWLMRLSVRWS